MLERYNTYQFNINVITHCPSSIWCIRTKYVAVEGEGRGERGGEGEEGRGGRGGGEGRVL